MTLERFGFRKRSSDEPQVLEESTPCHAVDPVVKKPRYNSGWAENRPWLQYDRDLEVMFCVWCRQHDRNPDRNQFAKGCSSMKVESIKNTRFQGSIKIVNQPIEHVQDPMKLHSIEHL